jgi:hypothetical protein
MEITTSSVLFLVSFLFGKSFLIISFLYSCQEIFAISLLSKDQPLPCPNGLSDGNYIFRSSSEEDWSFCGVAGLGFHEFEFSIRDCECFNGTSNEVCASTANPDRKPLDPTFISTPIYCSNDDYSISPTDTCLLVTLSDQFGDGWTTGDGSSENAWFGYSFSSSSSFPNGDNTSAITYHSLSCSCPRKIGCIDPSFASSGDQLINLAIYPNTKDREVEDTPAFSWEIMYLVQVIQNGQLMDSYYGGYRTQMEFRYTHSSGTLTLSSKTDGSVGNGDAVDVSGCADPVVGLMSEFHLVPLKGWSIVDINNKHEPVSGRNPFCFHTRPSFSPPIPSLA